MKRFAAALILFSASLAAAQISPEFFGMHVNRNTDPWPSTVGVQFSTWRTVASEVKWSDINTAPGVYDWTNLDRWLSYTSEHGQSVLYTFYFTPSWASQCPSCTCNSGNEPPGGCYPPNDLNADGTGSDQHVKDFITALMQHEGPGKIQYIEIWNEPNIPTEYAGTVQQLVSMARDVRQVAQSFDPNVKITSPPETGDGKKATKMQYLGQFLAAGGGQYVDVIGMHGYVFNPEDIIGRVNAATADMAQYGQMGKPLFVTEGSWCVANPCNSIPVAIGQQPGFTFRQYLAMLSTPVQKFYFFDFDSTQEGNLWSTTTAKMTGNGAAYQLFYNWLVGATMTQTCQAQSNGTTWSCTFTKSGGYQAEAIWDTSVTYPATINVTVPSQYIQYRDLLGNVVGIKNHQVPIGYSPIWLENGL